MEQNYIRKF